MTTATVTWPLLIIGVSTVLVSLPAAVSALSTTSLPASRLALPSALMLPELKMRMLPPTSVLRAMVPVATSSATLAASPAWTSTVPVPPEAVSVPNSETSPAAFSSTRFSASTRPETWMVLARRFARLAASSCAWGSTPVAASTTRLPLACRTISPPAARVASEPPAVTARLTPLTFTWLCALMSPCRITSPWPVMLTVSAWAASWPATDCVCPMVPESCIRPAPVMLMVPPAPVSMVAPESRTGSPPCTGAAPLASTAPVASTNWPAALTRKPSAVISRPLPSTK